MVNLLGIEGKEGKTRVCGLYDALSLKGVNVHIYGKSTTKPHRKMGHITVCADSIDEAQALAEKAYNFISVTTE